MDLSLLLPLIPGLPLVLAVLLSLRCMQPDQALTITALVSAMALLVAALGAQPLHLDWLLLGMRFQVDVLSRGLLAVAGLLWTAAAVSALPVFRGLHGRRFAVCFLLAMAGNLGVLVVQDMAGFYLWFALMTFACFGLVVHDGSAEARRAGRIYLTLAVMGEALLLAGLFSLAALDRNPVSAALPAVYAQLAHPQLTAGLIVAGFAVKMGVIPLHVWLPLAHPAAPVPASAVLSGIILKAGLVGWLRLLPGEAMMLPAPGQTLLLLGVSGALLAALVGCFQHRPKTVLAYSSVSQMGLLSALAGAWLLSDGARALALEAAMLVFAVHHGLAKGALFLAMEHLRSNTLWSRLLTGLPALAIAGAPMTSGLLAKAAFKSAAPESMIVWVTLSSVTTSLLLIRFLVLIWPHRGEAVSVRRPALVAWLLVIASAFILPWHVASDTDRAYALEPGNLVDGIWPIMLAALLAVTAWRLLRVWPRLPEGDVLCFMERGGACLGRWLGAVVDALNGIRERLSQPLQHHWPSRLVVPELGVALVALLLLVTSLIFGWLL